MRLTYEEMAQEVRNLKVMTRNITKIMSNAPDLTNMRRTATFLIKYYKETRDQRLHDAIEALSAGATLWLKDYSEENYGSEDDPHYHYPLEGLEDFTIRMEEDPDELAALVRFSLEDCFVE